MDTLPVDFDVIPKFGVWRRPLRIHHGSCAQNIWVNSLVFCVCGMQVSQVQNVVVFLSEARIVSHSSLWIVLSEGEIKVASLLVSKDLSDFFQEKW